MQPTFSVTDHDRLILRALARKQADYAHLPVMEQRRQRWHEHNELRGAQPMLVMETDTFLQDLLPKPGCETECGRKLENLMNYWIANHELVDDDKVVPPYLAIPWQIQFNLFDLNIRRDTADDGSGHTLGHRWEHPITDVAASLDTLKPSTHSLDRAGTLAWRNFVNDLIGDILPAEIENHSLLWFFMPTALLIYLMGMETMMVAMLDTPDAFQALLTRIDDDLLAHLQWQEDEGLLTLNNLHHYVGAGSFGFTRELPTPDCRATGKVTASDLWMNMNSQESVGVSPGMFGEWIFPHYRRLAEKAGLLYYGCCEPVHAVWDDYIRTLPRLRKVSVSAWCDEAFMADRLRGSRVIYSRKPSPNFMGIGAFDEEGYARHIAATLKTARGCTLEIIHRDVYTLQGDLTRPGRAIAIARLLIDELWEG